MSINLLKEEFELLPKEEWAFEKYTIVKNNILIIIRKECFDDDAIRYAEKVLNYYLDNEENIIENMMENGLSSFYNGRYTSEYIKENLNSPQIEIIKNGWGTITYLNHNLDEHIIEVEFHNDDIILSDVNIDG